MNSFWETVTTPLRYFRSEAPEEEPIIPPPAEPVQIPAVYDELPSRRTLSFEQDSLILPEPGSPTMIDPETLGAAVLNERLNNLRIIEEIEAIQSRRKLSLGQLAQPDAGNDPFYESQDLLRELARLSRLMAHSQSKAAVSYTHLTLPTKRIV